MGLRLGRFGELPEVTESNIRFGWDFQSEHEHGLEVDLTKTRWTDLLGFRALVIGDYEDSVLTRIWEREGTIAEGPVWVLWKEDAAVLWFSDRVLATTVEQAIEQGRATIAYEPRVRGIRTFRGDEGVLSWKPC